MFYHNLYPVEWTEVEADPNTEKGDKSNQYTVAQSSENNNNNNLNNFTTDRTPKLNWFWIHV